jgi:hypothetical protein
VPLGALPVDPGSYVVDAYFSGTVPLPGGALTFENDRYNPSSATATLLVDPEQATPTYTRDLLAATGVSFTAQASVAQQDDGAPGDITKAQVRFTMRDGAATVVHSVLANVGAGGVATATLAGVPTGVYTIDTEVEGGFFDSSPVQTLFASYDPSAGFVTGGGWIVSPAGAYLADPDATGKAHFAFVSKYQRGATAPSGNTQFQFETVGLTFKSTSYEWLVVSGKKAQYKGAGTLNGVAGYQFLLTATDGDSKQADDPDRFRIKIWDAAGLVYDNASGSPDDLDNANPQVIAGGSVVIQR